MDHLADGEVNVLRRYLANLNVLESAILRSAENLDTDQAAVWTRNRSEVMDRERLYKSWRVRLCGFLGIPPGPGVTGQSGRLIV